MIYMFILLGRWYAGADKLCKVIGLTTIIFKPNFMLIISGLIAAQCNLVAITELARPIRADLQRGLWIPGTFPECIGSIPNTENPGSRTTSHTDLNINLTTSPQG